MSVPFENVDAAILNNMGDLSSVIGNSQYQAGSPEQLPEGTNLSGVGDPNAPADIGQYVGNVAQPGQVAVQQGVVPQQQIVTQPVRPVQQPGLDVAERTRLEQAAQQAALRAIDAEERAFQAEIANLSDEEKEVKVLRRELEQTRDVNGWLNGQVTQVRGQMTQAQQQQQERLQQAAKNQWGFLHAHRYGLPYENPAVRAALLNAESPQHMEMIAQNMVQIMNGQARVASQNTLNSGILHAGSGPAGPATQQGPKKGSGDLSGLLAVRQPQAVNWG